MCVGGGGGGGWGEGRGKGSEEQNQKECLKKVFGGGEGAQALESSLWRRKFDLLPIILY